MKTILIVDSDAGKIKELAKIIEKRTGMCHIHLAQDGIEAVNIIDNHKLDLVLTSVDIPGIDGLELLTYIGKDYPDVKVIVMVSERSKIVSAQIKKLGGAVFPENTVTLSNIANRVFADLQFESGGKIQGISLPSFLQMIELEGKTCTLAILSGEKKGYLYFFEGTFIAAKTGEITGKAAALEILGWEHIVIEIDYSALNVNQQVNMPLMSLLLESRRMLDEKGIRGHQQRAHERYDCVVSVDYDIDDWAYISYLRNISEGGAYIEMNQPVKLGEEIILTFSTENPPRSCNISGTVVRRDERGVGVKFNELSLLQREMIDLVIKSKK